MTQSYSISLAVRYFLGVCSPVGLFACLALGLGVACVAEEESINQEVALADDQEANDEEFRSAWPPIANVNPLTGVAGPVNVGVLAPTFQDGTPIEEFAITRAPSDGGYFLARRVYTGGIVTKYSQLRLHDGKLYLEVEGGVEVPQIECQTCKEDCKEVIACEVNNEPDGSPFCFCWGAYPTDCGCGTVVDAEEPSTILNQLGEE